MVKTGRKKHPLTLNNNLIDIDSNSVFGRYLLAADEIICDEIVIDEPPFVYGPKLNSPVICLGCYCKLECNSNESRCPTCKWPLCSECIATMQQTDHSGECEVFSEARARFQNLIDDKYGCPQLDCITPLRLLLKMEADPQRWEQEVEPMESHDKARQENKEVWHADLINVARYLRGPCKLSRFSEEQIMRAIGILEVNAFEARTSQGYPIRCLFPITGILAHNCVPNTARSIYPSEGFRVRLRAMTDLRAGQQLHHSYTYTLDGTAARQKHLKAGKYFVCKCARCSDPTELGTYFSSFLCKQCLNGFISTTKPFDPEAIWKCSKCSFTVEYDIIQEALDKIQSEYDEVNAMPNSPERLDTTQILLKKFSHTLSPLHYILTALRQNLIEMYGRVEGYEMHRLSLDQLKYKETLCHDVLKILNKFEPGLSRSKALLLYDLHIPVVLMAKTNLCEGKISIEEFKKKLQEGIGYLYECHNTLQNEDPVSHEGHLARIAQQALLDLRDSLDEL